MSNVRFIGLDVHAGQGSARRTPNEFLGIDRLTQLIGSAVRPPATPEIPRGVPALV